jgi:hypothetical protein
MADGLQVISARLLYTPMSINGGITSSTCKVLAILVGYMFTFRVLVALGETKVNNIDRVLGLFSSTDQKVIRLDVTVNDALLMHLLDSFDHLMSNQEYCLKIEVALARLE